ncbi:MAG: 2-phospho-L-lactate transferase [Candidatus Acidiferrales bacterium]
MIVVLTGGTGGAKFAEGLQQVARADELTFIVNTGDDLRWWGLPVSPDLDSITYALAGLLSRERGWGIEGDTFDFLGVKRSQGAPVWFRVGDRDLATHRARAQILAEGRTLSEATQELVSRLGVAARILPMSDDRVETRVETPLGELSFEEYFVRERHQVPVTRVRFVGAEQAQPALGVLEAIERADAILLAPSNPITSLGPILAVPGIRQALRASAAPVVAVSPIVGGAAVSGPAAALMEMEGFAATASGVARAYADFLDVLVVDSRDTGEIEQIEALGVYALATNTIMTTTQDRAALAEFALEAARHAAPREAAR